MRRKKKRQEGERKRRVNRLSFFINILKEKIIFMTQDRKIDIIPVEGYDPKNYHHKRGIDATGNDVVSNKVVEQTANLILSGYTDSTIRDRLYETYGVNSYQARFIIGKAHTYIMEYEEEQEKNMLKKQNSRLFGLYRSAMNKGDEKIALAILSEINKLNKLYVNKIEISSDNFVLDLGLSDTTNKSDEQSNQ